MRDIGTPSGLGPRRLLAVQRALEGDSTEEVAESLDVDPRSVRRWIAAYRKAGGAGPLARPAAGRPRQLTDPPEEILPRGLADTPTGSGFATDLWTGPRRAPLIREGFGIPLNPKSLTVWLRRRGFTPQKPRRVPRQRDPAEIAAGRETQGPRLKGRPDAGGRGSRRSTRAAC